jgi:hypothetical protein
MSDFASGVVLTAACTLMVMGSYAVGRDHGSTTHQEVTIQYAEYTGCVTTERIEQAKEDAPDILILACTKEAP